MSWLLPPNSSASVCLPFAVSNTYFFSTFSHGNSRRFLLSASRALVNAFSSARCALRAAIHSSWETILCGCIVCSSSPSPRVRGEGRDEGASPLGSELSDSLERGERSLRRRRHPADAGAIGLHQDGDATDAGHVECGLHQLGADFHGFGHARIDVV